MKMKKLQIRKAIFIFAASLAFALNANAQPALKNVSTYYDETTGAFKYTDNNTLGKKRRVNPIDNLESAAIDGEHWNGDEIIGGEGQEYLNVYLVNKATGEYFVLGDAWGTTPMTDYTGTKLDLIGGKVCRADNLAALNPYQVDGEDPTLGTKTDRVGKGFMIRLSTDHERCIGRRQTASGGRGAFEERPLMMLRSTERKEYTQHPNDGYKKKVYPYNNDDGHMIFYFHPVAKGEDGKQYYVIYTHRQTTGPLHESFYDALDDAMATQWSKTIEYGNRDSYLCLRSQLSDNSDYNVVTYKKFAGKMYYDAGEKYYFEYYNKYSNDNGFRPATSTSTNYVAGPAFCSGWGDEESYHLAGTKEVTLSEGLTAVKDDDNCLWKIVTEEERKKYRVLANADNPVDMSFLINNHKFYTYERPYETGGLNLGDDLDFGWEWHNNETTADMHTHPYTSKAASADNNYEFHKIGTNYYDCWGWGEETTDTSDDSQKPHWRAKSNEGMMTQGEEANFVGSIYNGSAALRQTITGLPAGRYIVYCRAFFAPYDMSKFDNKNGWGTYNYNDSEGKFTGFTNSGTPTFNSGDIGSDVQNVINAQPLSDNSFLFAIGKDGVERKRDVPSIFCGMMPLDYAHLQGMTKEMFADVEHSAQFYYTPLGETLNDGMVFDDKGTEDEEDDEWYYDNTVIENKVNSLIGHTYGQEYNLLLDKTVFAKISYDDGEGMKNYFVPRNLAGAARFFNAIDRTKHKNAFNYRIGVPVEVGSDGILTIGIDHKANNEHANEWVCFDNFELVFYGVDENWEFVVDEGEPDNCTRYHDFFDWEPAGWTVGTERSAKVAIKRSLDQSKFTPIVLPFALTNKQVKQAFGDEVKISEPNTISYRTIHFKKVEATGADDAVCMQAYRPYIVKPSLPAPISSTQTWSRSRRDGLNPFGWSDETWNSLSEAQKKEIYVPTKGRNNQMWSGGYARWKNIPGPIYFADGVVIDKETHYTQNKENSATSGKTYYDVYYRASGQWPAVGNMYWGDKRVKIKGSTDGKTYQLRSTCYYNPSNLPDQVDGRTIQIPPYSYYFDASGNMKFNGARGSLQSKGFSFYLQIVELDTKTANIITFRTATDATPPNGAYSTDNTWSQEFTTNDASGYAGVKVKANWANAFGKSNGYSTRCFAIKPSAKGATNDVITIEAPDGYLIDGYEIGGWAFESGGSISETYTLKTGDESASLAINSKPATTGANQQPPTYLRTSGLGVKSTTLKLVNSNSNNSYYALIPHFVVNLVQDPTYTSPSDPSGAKVFAGSVGDFEWVEVTPTSEGDDASETNGITETFREYENPANDRYYDLQGRPVKTPRKNGIYIFHGKKIVY